LFSGVRVDSDEQADNTRNAVPRVAIAMRFILLLLVRQKLFGGKSRKGAFDTPHHDLEPRFETVPVGSVRDPELVKVLAGLIQTDLHLVELAKTPAPVAGPPIPAHFIPQAHEPMAIVVEHQIGTAKVNVVRIFRGGGRCYW
jgi:hypothetical protein